MVSRGPWGWKSLPDGAWAARPRDPAAASHLARLLRLRPNAEAGAKRLPPREAGAGGVGGQRHRPKGHHVGVPGEEGEPDEPAQPGWQGAGGSRTGMGYPLLQGFRRDARMTKSCGLFSWLSVWLTTW